jgi:hypothetical protein
VGALLRADAEARDVVTGFNGKTDLLRAIFFVASRDNVLNALKAGDRPASTYRGVGSWMQLPRPISFLVWPELC